ncbi:hypothetical protein H6F67_24120 [Microcoleus sp. FACHB-1515]|uniref:hypothetical protein n=1 Tax=Cyanophyceae TaxID=3028117 RepID=UPI001687E0FD|nr:hypothetical protein [Microcoleus sp. FACHB-1515]MBD2092939.1 hypothetical protein [Microcoleus sp. FACHB-1515]
MKKLPWLSLALLLAAYTTLSWLLYRLNVTWQLWAIVLGLALTQAFLLTTFSHGVQQFLEKWLRSDLGYFSVILLLAMLGVFFLAWFHFFGHLLVLLAAEILARLDLRRAGYTRVQALMILVLVSLLGLGVGGTAYYYKYSVPNAIEQSQETDTSSLTRAAPLVSIAKIDQIS